ncbi:MAG TPA: hypothetical protein VLD39_15850 [Gammaproteobacteria bacterium]|nr:hypothetical protein [Gammaproteobacteria bacterium]
MTFRPHRVLERAFTAGSWIGLVLAVAATAAALGLHWCIDAESLGARDAGMALGCSMGSSVLLVGGLYAAPSLLALGVIGFTIARRAGLLLLAAGLIAALPFAVLR